MNSCTTGCRSTGQGGYSTFGRWYPMSVPVTTITTAPVLQSTAYSRTHGDASEPPTGPRSTCQGHDVVHTACQRVPLRGSFPGGDQLHRQIVRLGLDRRVLHRPGRRWGEDGGDKTAGRHLPRRQQSIRLAPQLWRARAGTCRESNHRPWGSHHILPKTAGRLDAVPWQPDTSGAPSHCASCSKTRGSLPCGRCRKPHYAETLSSSHGMPSR